mmetsp:Transcript_13535/g.38081  ORF Transcript_13535/g.38081 Transcript_13535/m.38081 type:complete len:868 (-) Transcript_13535:508-3111(-)
MEQEEPPPERVSEGDDSSSSSSSATGTAANSKKRPSLSLSTLIPNAEDQTSPASDSRFDLYQSASCESFSYKSSSTVDFEDFDLDLPYRWYKRAWSIVMCITGIFDILAYLEPSLRRSYNEGFLCIPKNATTTTSPDFIEFGEGVSNLLVNLDKEPSLPFYCSIWATFLDRLRDYNVVIAFVFSLLWFKQSHIKAKDEYHYNTTVKEDRIALLSPSVDSSVEVTSNMYNDNNEIESSGGIQSKKKKNSNPSIIYYRRIILRMALLPIGFYVILFHLTRGLMNGKWLYRELLIERPANEMTYLTIKDPNEYVTIDVSKTHAKMSTMFAIFLYLKYNFLLATKAARARLGAYYIPQLRRKLVVKACRNPRNFIRQLNMVLQYVRWIKYTIPLLLKLNKLRGNAVTTLKNRRLFAKAKNEARVKKLLEKSISKKKTQAEIERDAAILTQRVWRAYQNRLHNQMLASFSKSKRLKAAMTIQLTFRRMSIKARISMAEKRRELNRLERLKREKSKQLNDDERRRLYELQDEFLAEAKKTINKRLLMRPNTWFAFSWNALFVYCILLEISHNALKPWLAIPKAQQTDLRKMKSMRSFVAESLIPTPVEETSTCKEFLQKKSPLHRLFFRKDHVERPTRREVMSAFIDEIIDSDYDLEEIRNDTNHTAIRKVPWRCSEPILTWRENWRNVVRLVFCPKPLSEWPSCQQPEKTLIDLIISPFHKRKEKPLPWYCAKSFISIHNFYRWTWNFIIDQIQIVISIICFLDVFVKFFTGEIDPVTGELRPKPFVRRWLFPGLLLQLLVNPAIGAFSTAFFRFADWVMVIGPVRVLRWCIAVVVPIAYGLRNIVIATLQDAAFDRQLALYGMILSEYSHW